MIDDNQIDLSDSKYSRIIIFRTNKFSNLSNNIVKKIRNFNSKIINEPFHYARKEDPIWIAFLSLKENEDPKNMKEVIKSGYPIIGICMLTLESPHRHFDNEKNGVNIPYLYNMMVDIKNPITKELKVAPILLTAVKNDVQDNKYLWKWLNSQNPKTPEAINIDVIYKEESECSEEFYEKSQHALKFYEKNGFIKCSKEFYKAQDGEGTVFKFNMMNFLY